MQSYIFRLFGMIAVLLAITTVKAQNSYTTIESGITVVVKEHPTTADMVEITALDAKYPEDLLRQQIATIGKYLGSAPRGVAVAVVSIDEKNPDMRFLKASFAIDGLIDRNAEELRVEPIVKAFAGAPAPFTLKGLTILFDGESPNRNTVKDYGTKYIQGHAEIFPPLQKNQDPSIEYTITYLSQDPDKIDFPSRFIEQKTPLTASQAGDSLPSYVWIAIIIAGLSAGALVYLALAKRAPARR